MPFKNNFVVAIKVNNNILREIEDKVYLPFNSEFSILLKNLNSVKANVNIWIDGTLVTERWPLTINANSSFELERYIKNGNLEQGNRFKFIQKTDSIEEYRESKIDDGLIRIEFSFAKSKNHYIPQIPPLEPNRIWGPAQSPFGPLYCSNDIRSQFNVSSGITVPGSISNQKITTLQILDTDPANVIVIQLFGNVNSSEITKPITVKSKLKCQTCGKINKIQSKFCNNCGTSLEII